MKKNFLGKGLPALAPPLARMLFEAIWQGQPAALSLLAIHDTRNHPMNRLIAPTDTREDPIAITDERAADSDGQTERAHYCPQCGHLSTEGRFCTDCGHPLDTAATSDVRGAEQPTIAAPPPPTSPPPAVGAPPAANAPRSRIALIVAGGALGLIAIAVAAIILLTGSNSNTADPYRQKLTVALTPVLSTNTALSNTLTSLHGKNTAAAKNAAGQAQSAVTAARGAVAVLTVPSADAQLAQQVQQALTQESGYLQAVSATLAHPSAENISPLQTLATNTQSALVPIVSPPHDTTETS